MTTTQRLGRYVVQRRLGSGGFATVWLAHDEQLDSPVAVKVLADNWAGDPDLRRRFTAEGRWLRRVQSPHVVPVYDAGETDDGRPFLVMAFADRGTLADLLATTPVPPPAQALAVLRQVGAGLDALHERGVLHRDVKPANVLFTSDRGPGGQEEVRALLGDLGLGKDLEMSSRLSLVGGTPSWVAPEQARAEPLDARADQYSLAALAYLLLAGRPPYRHADLAAAAHPAPPPPLDPPALDAVVRRGLAADREERHPSIAAFLTALAAALGSPRGAAPAAVSGAEATALVTQLTAPAVPDPEPPEPTSTTVPTRRRPVGRVLLATAAALAVVAAGVGLGWLGAGLAAGRGGAVTVRDDSGSLQVTVPATWDRAVGRGPWTPPGEDGGAQPALSVGTGPDWTEDGEGVFVAVLAASDLPDDVPQHPECAAASGPVEDDLAGEVSGTSLTTTSTGCPGGGVVVERLVQVATNRLLWVQVRAADRPTAVDVLSDVATRGL